MCESVCKKERVCVCEFKPEGFSRVRRTRLCLMYIVIIGHLHK